MTDTTQPSAFDLMELASFEAKADWEGSKKYAYDEWTWTFEDAALNERAGTFAGFMEIFRENQDAVDAWNDSHEGDAASLINAHRDEKQKRRDDACLWAVRRNGRIFPQPTRERAEYFLKPGNVLSGTSYAVLKRDEPGGEWREIDAHDTTVA
jgi:hypothetical protein